MIPFAGDPAPGGARRTRSLFRTGLHFGFKRARGPADLSPRRLPQREFRQPLSLGEVVVPFC